MTSPWLIDGRSAREDCGERDPSAGDAAGGEKDGTTTMTVAVLAASKEARDAVVASGMEHGEVETYDRLPALLEG